MMTSLFRTLILLALTFAAIIPELAASDAAGIESFPIEARGGNVPFFLYRPASSLRDQASDMHHGSRPPTGLLLLIPGFNGSGQAMLDDRWRQFADQNHLVLLAPTFTATDPKELLHGRGYYYPEQGSGEQVELALEEAHRRTDVPVDHILIFGFSAGAHFAHRFALWKPEQVSAFVAYSAAWWSDPSERLRNVPALIMCGESDERYEATRTFMEDGLALGLPWIWRSYKNTGHELTPPVRTMAEVFLAYQADHMKEGGRTTNPSPMLYGDIQTYSVIPPSERDSIPEQVRIALPSQAIADTWIKEN